MSLLSPWYLAALAALALPWLLHRFNDSRPDSRPFPSTRFLEATAPPVSRRHQLRHRLLLSLRALALLALCVLFAEPWVSRPEALGDARRLHVLAVDVSLSMRAGERFERARDAARDMLADVPPDDPVVMMSFANEVVRINAEPATADVVAADLTRLEPGYARADYGQVMQRIGKLASESSMPTRAVLISDLQQSALPDRRGALFAPDLGALELVDVGRGESNVALTAEATSDNGAQARIIARVISSSTETLERTVIVSDDGGERARRRVRLPPMGRENVVFDAMSLPESGAQFLTLALEEEDDLAADDAVVVDVLVDGERQVALAALDGRVAAAPRVFVSTALEADDGSRVDVDSLGTGQLPLEQRRMVVFTPLGADAGLPDALRRYVARGGAALVIDASVRDDSSLALEGSGVGLVDETHALGLGEIDWGDTRFFGLGGYLPREGDRVLIETADRRPVLIERPSENGRLLILNERLDGVDGNLPFQPAFVTLMRLVVDWFDASRAVPSAVLAGEPVALPVNVQVIDPDGRSMVSLSETAQVQSLSFDMPGRYTVVSAFGDQSVTVGVDPRESDLSILSDDDRTAWVERHRVDSDVADEQSPAADDSWRDPDAGTAMSLWPMILPLLAVLLLAETLLANRRLDVRRAGT